MSHERAADAAPAGPDEEAGPPLVSVVMIFMNGEQFIEEAIESVFSQTWPHWELLLVDDGSTDRSTKIACGYAERHPERVRCLEHPDRSNRGMSASRNLGIAHARGKYLAFLDADDVFLPDRLAKHVAVLEARAEVDMVQSTLIFWFSWTGDGEEDHPLPSIGPVGVVMTPPTMLSLYLNTPHSPGICSVTARREAVAEIDGFEDAFKGFCEDRVFLAKMYATKNTFVIDEPLALYRRHPDSLTLRALLGSADKSLKIEQFNTRKEYFLWLRRYLRSRSIDEPALDAAIERQLRLEDEKIERVATEKPSPRQVLEATVIQLVRLVLPNSLRVRMRVRRRNRNRARQWQQVRAELDRLRRDYEPAAVGGHRLEDHAIPVQAERASPPPAGRRAREDGRGAERDVPARARHPMTAGRAADTR